MLVAEIVPDSVSVEVELRVTGIVIEVVMVVVLTAWVVVRVLVLDADPVKVIGSVSVVV